ncbi:Abi family protein [Edwardsiella hoshinae]|uniref:Abi family protein n=1 Tax=Edwardsiella hoshinae TaxID=93378 RepID=UPI0012E9CC03
MIKKTSLVGYYRLSGFGYPLGTLHTMADNIRTRVDNVRPDADFTVVYAPAWCDERMRLLMMSVLQRIEIYAYPRPY